MTRTHHSAAAVLALVLAAVVLSPPTARAQSFTDFESGQMRPLALSPDGNTLYAVNTPDNRLEVFAVTGGGLTHTASVPVGLEPVAARSNAEIWVVNHLSDSISVQRAAGNDGAAPEAR